MMKMEKKNKMILIFSLSMSLIVILMLSIQSWKDSPIYNVYNGNILIGFSSIFIILLFGIVGFFGIKLWEKIFKKDFITFKKEK